MMESHMDREAEHQPIVSVVTKITSTISRA